jgi:hypothetical protein
VIAKIVARLGVDARATQTEHERLPPRESTPVVAFPLRRSARAVGGNDDRPRIGAAWRHHDRRQKTRYSQVPGRDRARSRRTVRAEGKRLAPRRVALRRDAARQHCQPDDDS